MSKIKELYMEKLDEQHVEDCLDKAHDRDQDKKLDKEYEQQK